MYMHISAGSNKNTEITRLEGVLFEQRKLFSGCKGVLSVAVHFQTLPREWNEAISPWQHLN